MSKVCRLGIVFILISNVSWAFAKDGDPCSIAIGAAPVATAIMESSRLDAHGIFIGTFKIMNLSRTSTLRFGGFSKDGSIYIKHPATSLEYLDITNEWRRILDLPGSFPQPPDRLVVAPGETQRFMASLVTPEVANQSAREFRLLIRSIDLSYCVVSVPFHGYPPRPKVERFESARL